MSLRSLGTAGALAVMATACSGGLSVSNDWDPNVDFANYQTFVVMDEATGGAQISSFISQRIKQSIADDLTAKGLRRVNSADAADAAVGWQVTTEQRSSFSTVSTGWGGYGWGGYGGWYGRGMGMGGMAMTTSTTTEQRYTVGALVIAVFDVKKEEMIFTAEGSKELAGDNPTPEESQQRIDDAVQKILANFPPSPGSQPE